MKSNKVLAKTCRGTSTRCRDWRSFICNEAGGAGRTDGDGGGIGSIEGPVVSAEINVDVAPTGLRRIVPPSWWSVSKPFSVVVVDDTADDDVVESTSLKQQLLSSESLRCSCWWVTPPVIISCCCQLLITVGGWNQFYSHYAPTYWRQMINDLGMLSNKCPKSTCFHYSVCGW